MYPLLRVSLTLVTSVLYNIGLTPPNPPPPPAERSKALKTPATSGVGILEGLIRFIPFSARVCDTVPLMKHNAFAEVFWDASVPRHFLRHPRIDRHPRTILPKHRLHLHPPLPLPHNRPPTRPTCRLYVPGFPYLNSAMGRYDLGLDRRGDQNGLLS